MMFLESTTNLLYMNSRPYSYGQNGLVDSLRAIFNDFTFENQRYAQMLLRF